MPVQAVNAAENPQYEPGSFRDRDGRVVYREDAVYRLLSERSLADWRHLSQTTFFKRFVAAGKIVPTVEVDISNFQVRGKWSGALRHQRIPFISYPYEWSFSMLQTAALLQLELLLAALEEEMTIKDASSFNVQWHGAKPVFIDILSFEKWKRGSPWAGYRQFCQLFLYPLFLQSYKNAPFHHWLRGKLDGIDVDEMYGLVTLGDLFRRGIFKHVYLHKKLQGALSDTKRDIKNELKAAGFHKELIKANVRGLQKLVAKLSWKENRSTWVRYAANTSYSAEDDAVKAKFVSEVIGLRQRQLVWDIGCNTGRFSRIAAENSAYVVAMDSDHLSVERLYEALTAEGIKNILPLVMNVADASPNLGWRGIERKALTERGRPDLVLALALIHHLVISANIPLDEVISWFANLGSELVIEFVTKQDVMVQTLLRNKEDIYWDYTTEYFEQCLSTYYRIERKQVLGSNTRILYHCVKHSLL